MGYGHPYAHASFLQDRRFPVQSLDRTPNGGHAIFPSAASRSSKCIADVVIAKRNLASSIATFQAL